MRTLAILCLTFAVIMGSTPGCRSPGDDAYQRGDYTTAIREWELMAEQGVADAQFNLGWIYDEGRGVPQDYKAAVKWYTLAAKQGYVYAQYNLGVMFDEGEDVPHNYENAVKWYTLAAKQGYVFAQCNLGVMYDEGRGVQQDYQTAVKWYTLAAEQGDIDAHNNLKSLKLTLVNTAIGNCLDEGDLKIIGSESKGASEEHCRSLMKKKSLDWLIKNEG